MNKEIGKQRGKKKQKHIIKMMCLEFAIRFCFLSFFYLSPVFPFRSFNNFNLRKRGPLMTQYGYVLCYSVTWKKGFISYEYMLCIFELLLFVVALYIYFPFYWKCIFCLLPLENKKRALNSSNQTTHPLTPLVYVSLNILKMKPPQLRVKNKSWNFRCCFQKRSELNIEHSFELKLSIETVKQCQAKP